MSLTPRCDTPGCRRMSVHVLPYEKILGKVRKAHRFCPGCYSQRFQKRATYKEES